MLSVAERKRRRRESNTLRNKRMILLAELDDLEGQECDDCKKVASSNQVTCCSVSLRKREIGKELSHLLNERTEIEKPVEEVRKVSRKRKAPEMTEEMVSEMRAKGMTLAEIGKEFGVSAPTISNRLQIWDVERVRKKHKEKKNASSTPKNEVVTDIREVENTPETVREKVVATIPDFKEGDIKCGSCGKEIHLWYNGGELDHAFCCGYKYQTKHVRTDLFISLVSNQ